MTRARLAALACFVAAAGIVAILIASRGSGAPDPFDDRRLTRDGQPLAAEDLRAIDELRARHSIVLLTLDTTRADHLEPYGATHVATPHLGALADAGVTFERASAVTPITLPAHTSIFTGRYPPVHGVRNNGTHRVDDATVTLAETLADAGYATAAFVSAAVLERQYGLDQGFAVYDDDLSTSRTRHPRVVPDRPANVTVDAARAWLDALAEDRFFLWVHLYDPHAAYSPPPPFRDRYREQPYAGEIAFMDAEIGRLLDHPRLADAVVVAVGDHGESLGEHDEMTHGILAYDATLHVPLIVRLPGAPAGARVTTPVSQVDLMPTLLDLLDLAPAAADDDDETSFDGSSLLPLLASDGGPPGGAAADGEARSTAAREAEAFDAQRQSEMLRLLYSESYLPFYTYGWAKLRAVRRGPWKYIDGPDPELFDLRRDPRELTNLIEARPHVAHDLQRDLMRLVRRSGDVGAEITQTLDSESAERLRSLGYLSVGAQPTIADDERPDPKSMIDVHVGLERARALERDRLWDAAIRQLRTVLGRDPNNLAALTDLVSLLEQSGQVEEGLRAAERALALAPDLPRLHGLLARLEQKRGQPAQALAVLEAILERHPDDLDLRLQAVHLHRTLRQGDAMRATLEALIDDHPDHPRVLLARALLLERPAGDLDDAEASVRAALARDPFLIAGWQLLGVTLAQAGRADEAAEAWRTGLTRAPDDAVLHERLGLHLAARGDVTAADHLREAIRLNETLRPALHVALGGWLAERGQLDAAQAEYARVLAVQPKHVGARNNQAIALYRSGRADEARALLEQLIVDVPDQTDAHSNLAAIAADRGDWSRAERYARRALTLGPETPEAWNNLGLALEGQARHAEALGAYARALAVRDDYWQARYNAGLMRVKLDRPAEAADDFETVLQQRPGHAPSHRMLGDLYADALDEPLRARRHWNAFLRLVPSGNDAAAVRARLAEQPPLAAGEGDSLR
ncbi:MAG: sulfatase-like hydrolase/transferase [Acidobacteriota bacterium]